MFHTNSTCYFCESYLQTHRISTRCYAWIFQRCIVPNGVIFQWHWHEIPNICYGIYTDVSLEYQSMAIVWYHYSDVIMGAMASQITSLAIVYSTVYSGADQRKHQSSASLAFVWGEFPAQMASNAENISIWWHHHDCERNAMQDHAQPLGRLLFIPLAMDQLLH